MAKRNNKQRSYENEFTQKDLIKNLLPERINIKGKTDRQVDFIKAIKDSEIIICAGAAGVGKAQPLTSKILTPTGWATMGDINIGDEVITQNGGSTKVIGVFPQGMKDIYKVTFSDGTYAEACGEHLWLTQTYKDRNYKTKRNGDVAYIPKSGSIKNTIEIKNSLLTKDNKKNHIIPTVEPINFTKQEVVINPYIMGCILGDGGLTGGKIVISTSDIQIINEISERLPNGLVIEKTPSGKYEYVIKSLKRGGGNNIYLNETRNLDLFGLKSDEKFIPTEYLYNTTENRILLLQGLMDTDGYVDKSGYKVSFTTVSKKLCDGVVELVNSLGGVCTIKGKYKTYTHNGEKQTGKLTYSINISLPPTINPFILTRKAERVIPKTRCIPRRYITDVELIGKKEAQCIMVEHDSHLYVTDNYIVTHNTYVAVAKALQLVQQSTTKFEKICLSRPPVEMGKSVGFLPGDMFEKLLPYMMPLLDNIDKIIGKDKRIELMEKEIIEFIPLPFIRGKSFDNTILIADECQNASPHEMKTVLTRIGENSKFIITGDLDQSDRFSKVSDSGLYDITSKLKDIEGISMIEFMESDIVRNPIIKEILKRYK